MSAGYAMTPDDDACLCHCHATGYCDECGAMTGELPKGAEPELPKLTIPLPWLDWDAA